MHHAHRAPTRRLLLVALAAFLVLTASGGVTSHGAASADPVADLRSRAAEISTEMAQLEAQIREATNEVEEAEYRGSQLDQQISDAQQELARASSGEEQSRKQLAAYATRAYVSGGSGDDVSDLLSGESATLDQRRGYASSAVGDRQELIDQLRASQQRTQDKAADLSQKRATAKATSDRAEARRKQAQTAADRLAAIRSQLDGELATAVAEQQAAQQRAAEARARAEAEAQLAQQAQRAASSNSQQTGTQAATPSLPPVSTSTGSDSSSGDGSASGPNTSQPPVTGPNASAADIAISAAQSQLGVPYSWGGGGPNGPTFGIGIGAGTRGFDCSGLTQYAYAQAGVSLDHLTWSQMNQGRVVPLSQIQRGDLVFYWGGGHVALYVGNGQVIHAPHTGAFVSYGSLYMGTPELVIRPTG